MIEKVSVLLVEDNRGDVVLTREALRTAGIHYDLNTVENGLQALAFLYRQPPYEEAPAPDLIILDVNMPQMNGGEVLRIITASRRLRQIPLVIFTSAFQDQQDVPEYDPQRHLFLTKPGSFPGYVDAMKEIEEYRKSKSAAAQQ